MARLLSSPLLLLSLLVSASATTTIISFYHKNSCASDSPSAGDNFTSSNLVAGSGICYNPPINTIALDIAEIEDGCSSKPPLSVRPFLVLRITALLQSNPQPKWNHALPLYSTQQSVPREKKAFKPLTSSPKVTAYLDTTCSMPTSEALTSTDSLCYFLGPEEHIGSFKASCSRTITSTSTNESASQGHGDGSAATTSPGLQSTPTNGASSRVGPVLERWAGGGGWVEVEVKALMAIGAMEVVWGWGML
ncbi:hypothetical protein EPUS_08629 [Endocarpon pusillum Z07020]|uniref:Uncharacterized protein n=1 Tax=Endocarpon pusillum (strain Z07020 / HMAS-L-300199) TaxID=1263415 RepID=U1HXX7_ENDPU|nr:uncharacterized protein EPUS_08629 [Endocarpon pusillum Z07020]ERF75675.1 hypothetical protein EPUS_08629 [Endocarpon pusillum Z07020]